MKKIESSFNCEKADGSRVSTLCWVIIISRFIQVLFTW